jgi:protein-S-isoprenylcysteine O-methyltransferase Ste14
VILPAHAFAFENTPLKAATDIPAPALLLDLSGAGLVWLGMALRLSAVLTLGRFFRTSVFVHDDHQLVGHGPYRFLRNPGYTGSLITLAGLGLMLGNWASLAVVLAVMIAAYGLRIRAEERALGGRFGEAYEVYRKGRWALIPPIW